MSKNLYVLIENDDYLKNSPLKEADITKLSFCRHDKTLSMHIHVQELLTFDLYKYFIEYTENLFNDSHFDLDIEVEQHNINQLELNKYFSYFYEHYGLNTIFKEGLPKLDLKNQTLEMLFPSENLTDDASNSLKDLQNLFAKIGLKEFQVKLQLHMPESAPMIEEVPVIKVNKQLTPAVNKEAPQQFKRRAKVKLEDYTKISLNDVTDQMKNIYFDGEIFKQEDFTTKSGMVIQTSAVYDGDNAINIKRFAKRDEEKAELSEAKVGDYCRFYGSVSYDPYAKDIVFNVESLTKLDKPKIVDDAEEKRIEFHTHTNMSEMDGVCEAASIVKYAYNLGHEGIVITDHADVQSFVKAYNTASSLTKNNPDRPFKVGLGCEVNLAEDRLNIVYNISDQAINEAEYVAFDLETTGLSCKYDHIIEFGAVRIKDGMVTEHKQMFIKPPVSIPPFIANKTNITNDMVKNAKSFAEACDEIVEWIGEAVLVAHNASFDYNFFNEELRRIGKEPLHNTTIDTLDMSRAILKERRAYRLGNIARNYHISYDEEVAHRADYDAEVLGDVFLCLLKDAEKMGANTIRDIQEAIQDDDAFKKGRSSHTILIAKNKQGLKDLYKLVSMSNTKTLAVFSKSSKEGAEVAAEARVLRSAVNAVRENLLIGSSCQNNEVFELACNGDDERLEKAMSWYDYIELQPLSCYTTFVAMGNVPDTERLKTVQKRIIAMANKLHKPVIADSDAHYCTKAQKKFRDVYIMSQGVGGAIHPLYIRNDMLRYRTKNPDQHIRLTNEMIDEFGWLNDVTLVHQMVIDNPKKLFAQIESVRPVPAGTFPPTIEHSDDKLREICNNTAKNMYEFEGKIPDIVTDRLNEELDNIIRNGYGVHYYIAHLLVKKSNDDGYVVGSRGSVGSSFTATMSGITEVNALKPHYLCPHCHYSEWIDDTSISSGFDLPDKTCPHCGATMKGNGQNIPFQTFLGFNADKTPDIDLNFSNEYQAKAHAFIKQVFGEKHAFRAGTIGTVAEKTAYGYVQGYCEKMNITDMRSTMKDYLAAGCQNVKRTTGQHPGGIIIIPENYDAEDFTPVQYPANDPNSEWMTTHYDFHDIHDNVLKFDILGHVDPTAMRMLTNISKTDPLTIPMNDPESLSLFYEDNALKADPRVYKKETGALGLPEFGTRTTRRVLEETRPHVFSDLVIISGLSHGTDVWAGNAETLIQNGHALSEVIGCRDDIMTYLLNKHLEPIDAFRIMEDVRKGKGLKEDQEKKMREHDVPDWYIDSCKKIKYMFPKAHAVAYVMMAVRLAWYKVHEPWNFYIQYLTLRCDAYDITVMSRGLEAVRERMFNIDERLKNRETAKEVTNKEKSLYDTLEVCEELYARGYKISNVDLYHSKATEFCSDPDDNHIIIPPFVVIDGLGANVARSVEEARKNGEFLSKEDIIKRTQLSSTLVKKLDDLGCLEGMQESNQISLF